MKVDKLAHALLVAGLLITTATTASAARQRGGTDPAPAASEAEAVSIAPAIACPAGFYSVGATLCMTGALGPTSFANAMAYCQAIGGSVAGYGAWRYRVLYGDGIAAPVGWWLGPITGDDNALYVNSGDVGNFDGEGSRFDSRYYACSKG